MVERIGQVKQECAMPVYEPKREDEVFRNVMEHNGGPLPPDAVKRIFERVIDEMRTLQKLRMETEMIVVMQEGASEAQIQGVIDRMVSMNFTVHRSTGRDAYGARRCGTGGRHRSRPSSKCSTE